MDYNKFEAKSEEDICVTLCQLLKQLENKEVTPKYAKVLFDLKSKEWNIYTNRILKDDYEGLPAYIETDDLELLKNRLLNTQKVLDEIWSEIKKQLYNQ